METNLQILAKAACASALCTTGLINIIILMNQCKKALEKYIHAFFAANWMIMGYLCFMKPDINKTYLIGIALASLIANVSCIAIERKQYHTKIQIS